MKSVVKYFLDFYFYSSLHISIAAVLLTLESYLFFSISIDIYYLLFVFFSTLLIYSMHRIIGLRKLKGQTNQGRFIVIRKYKHHIRIYAIISLLALIWILIQMDTRYILFLIPAGIISVLYTFPVLLKGKRLRDYNYIKIFLIAVVWAYVCGMLPVLYTEGMGLPVLISGLEKAIFFLAITLPFDIRDYDIDRANDVKTLAHIFGKEKSWKLSQLLLIDGIIMGIILTLYIPAVHLAVICLVYLLSWLAIRTARGKVSDYYYSGLLDGLIIIRACIILAAVMLTH